MSEDYKDMQIAGILGQFSKLDMMEQLPKLQSTIDEIKEVLKHGVCADCRFNQVWERPSIDALCINEYMGELATKSDHSLTYPYNEGAKLETSPNFGCINFEPREPK